MVECNAEAIDYDYAHEHEKTDLPDPPNLVRVLSEAVLVIVIGWIKDPALPVIHKDTTHKKYRAGEGRLHRHQDR